MSEEKSKLYNFSFKVKDKRMPDGFSWIGLADRSLLSLASRVKLKGFKKGMEFETNLSIIEACELLHNVFPPKKKKNPVEGTLDRVDEKFTEWIDSINNSFDSENKLFAKPPKLDKELSMGEVVSEIEKMADDAKIYTIKRQPTFFCKETKVSYNELKKFFTDKAINSMIEDGFIERNHSKYPIDFIENYPITFEELEKDLFKENTKSIVKFMYDSEPIKISGGKPSFVFGFSDELDAENLKAFKEAEPKVFQAINPNSYIDDDLELKFDNVCDKLDFIIDQISENFSSDGFDIYISRTDSEQLNESFGGKVKKYKGHKIIVA